MLERKRMTRDAREAFVNIYAISGALDKFAGDLEQVARRVPNGWRDLRMVQVRLGLLVKRLLDTIPPEQMLVMAHDMEVSEFRKVTKSAGKPPGDFWSVSREDLSNLVNEILENKCALCDCTDPLKCKTRELILDLPVKGLTGINMPCLSGNGGLRV